MRQVDPATTLAWHADEGALLAPGAKLVTVTGKARSPEGRPRTYAEWAPEKPPPASVLAR